MSLKNLIEIYRKESVKFTAPGNVFPCILLVDNDDGAKGIVSIAQQIAKVKQARTEPFVRIFGNLYLVLTPIPAAGQSSIIEDFFTPQTKTTRINNKDFDPQNDYDTATHYGKATFSRYIEDHAATVDFTGFGPVLARLSEVINVHH